uniref:Uncharacterized protein n=1 Tax=Poecilia mexicana TaxID=48701 RepID=A0A3B3Y5G3_9TELE
FFFFFKGDFFPPLKRKQATLSLAARLVKHGRPPVMDVYLNTLQTVNYIDTGSEQSTSSASEQVQSILGNSGLNCLINNAAIGFSTNISTVTPEAMMTMFQVYTVAPLFVTKAFLPLLQTAAAKSGDPGMGFHRAAVINMSSVLGSITLNCRDTAKFRSYVYCTSKAALNMLTRCLAADLEPSKILCMSLHPGWVRTDMEGPHADLTVEQSVSGILSVLFGLSERDNGSP